MLTVSNPGPIDYEVSSVMRLIVEASSAGNFAYTTVWISLININDNKPQFSQDKYTTKVFEEQPDFVDEKGANEVNRQLTEVSV